MIETLKLCLHLTRRNWLVYRKDFLANISPTLADPLFYILSLGLGLGSFVSQIEGRSYLEFIAPGLTISTALFTSFFETSYGFYVRLTFENIFKAMLTTPIGVREVILGEFIWVALKGAVMSLGVTLVLAAFGLVQNLWLIPVIVIVGALVALACGAMGLIASSYVKNINQFQTVYSFLIAPLFFLSGIFFPLSQLPQVVRWIAYLWPLAPGVRLTQNLFWNTPIELTWFANLLILSVQALLLCSLAYYRTRKILQH